MLRVSLLFKFLPRALILVLHVHVSEHFSLRLTRNYLPLNQSKALTGPRVKMRETSKRE